MHTSLFPSIIITLPPLSPLPSSIDDFGWYNIGWRNPEIRSPALDALAADGIVLNRHYTFKYCSPTRASLLSGQYI